MMIAGRLLVAVALVCGVTVPLRSAEKSAAFDPAVARRITPEEVQQRQKAGEKAIIVDTRAGVGGEIVKGAIIVPGAGIEDWGKNVAKTALIVTYCT